MERKKLQVLMELHPCLYGFAGIPQETRLLFSYFLDIPSIQTAGLINVDIPYLSINNPFFLPQTASKKISQLSKLIISVSDPLTISLRDKLKQACRLWLASMKNKCGFLVPIGVFDSKGFEDFLWEQFFSKTLTTDEFERIVNALFCTLSFSPYAMHCLKRLDFNYLKIDTKDYDVLLVQKPFPGRVAKNTQLVVRYHDAIPLFFPHLTYHPKLERASHYNALCANSKSAFFVCSSDDTRTDLLQVFPQLEKRAHVIHDTISPTYFEESVDNVRLKQIICNYSYESRRALGAEINQDEEYYENYLYKHPLNYIVMVSTIEPRKNHIRLIRAWETVCARNNLPLKLILIGSLGWQMEPIVNVMRPWQYRGQLFHLQKVPVEHLRLLYQGASCVVCPSIKEGFDLSGVEAMACGGKIVASDIPVHREVYGNAAVYFDPYSFLKQAAAIESLVRSEENDLAKTLKLAGLKQAQRYQRNVIVPQWECFFDQVVHKKD